jgi:hypothetical protein
MNCSEEEAGACRTTTDLLSRGGGAEGARKAREALKSARKRARDRRGMSRGLPPKALLYLAEKPVDAGFLCVLRVSARARFS